MKFPVRHLPNRFDVLALGVAIGCAAQSTGKVDTSNAASPGATACPGHVTSASYNRTLNNSHACQSTPDPSGADRYSDLACACRPAACPPTIAAAIESLASLCRPHVEDFDSTVHTSPLAIMRRDGCRIVQVEYHGGFSSESYSYDAITGVLIGVTTTRDFCFPGSCTRIAGRTLETTSCANKSVCRLCGAGDSMSGCKSELTCGVDLTTPIDRRLFPTSDRAP